MKNKHENGQPSPKDPSWQSHLDKSYVGPDAKKAFIHGKKLIQDAKEAIVREGYDEEARVKFVDDQFTHIRLSERTRKTTRATPKTIEGIAAKTVRRIVDGPTLGQSVHADFDSPFDDNNPRLTIDHDTPARYYRHSPFEARMGIDEGDADVAAEHARRLLGLSLDNLEVTPYARLSAEKSDEYKGQMFSDAEELFKAHGLEIHEAKKPLSVSYKLSESDRIVITYSPADFWIGEKTGPRDDAPEVTMAVQQNVQIDPVNNPAIKFPRTVYRLIASSYESERGPRAGKRKTDAYISLSMSDPREVTGNSLLVHDSVLLKEAVGAFHYLATHPELAVVDVPVQLNGFHPDLSDEEAAVIRESVHDQNTVIDLEHAGQRVTTLPKEHDVYEQINRYFNGS